MKGNNGLKTKVSNPRCVGKYENNKRRSILSKENVSKILDDNIENAEN